MTEPDEIPWSEVPAETRLRHLGSMRVERRVEERIHAVFDQVRRTRTTSSEPANVLLVGETGVGKSDILARYLAQHPSCRRADGSMHRPVLSVEIKNMATPRSTAQQMLRLLGLEEPSFLRGSTSELTERVKHHLVMQGVELCLLDEFNNTLSDDGRVRSTKVATWVKDLCKSKTRDADHPNGRDGENICFAMIGTQKSRRIVDPTLNPELASLTPFQIDLPRYEYRTTEQVAEFRHFLDALDEELPFDEHSGLGLVDANGSCTLADKIHSATYGLLRPLGYLVREAARMAIEDGAPHVFERHLHESVERQRGILQSSLLIDDGVQGRVVQNPFAGPLPTAAARSAKKQGFKAAA